MQGKFSPVLVMLRISPTGNMQRELASPNGSILIPLLPQHPKHRCNVRVAELAGAHAAEEAEQCEKRGKREVYQQLGAGVYCC